MYYFILHSHFYVTPSPSMFPITVGWGNGYVLISKGHPYYGKHYDEIDAYSHGGLTFASKYENFQILQKYITEGYDHRMDDKLSKRITKEGFDFLDEYWCIGFDTAHHGDDLYTCPKDYVWKETKGLYKLCYDRDIKLVRKAKLKKLENERKK